MVKATWDIIGLIFLIYQSIIIPYRVSFNSYATGGFDVFEKLIDFFFIFDVVPNPGIGTHSIFPSTTSAQSLLETVEIFPENVNLVKPGFWGGLKPKPDHVVVTFIEGFFRHFLRL